MTIVKRIWELRGDLQTAIINKDEQKFMEIIHMLNSPSLEIEIMQTKIATKYEDLEKEWYNDILDRPKQLEKISTNVKRLRFYRIHNRKVDTSFGEEESVLHTIWVLRAKFERLKHYCELNKPAKTTIELCEEIMQKIMTLIESPNKYFTSHAEHDAMLNIKEEIESYYNHFVMHDN